MKVKDLRQTLLKKLDGEPYNFVVKVYDDQIEITEPKNKQDKTKTQKVIIHGIPSQKNIWRINVEAEVQGLSPIQERTVDMIMALIDNKCLRVYLIELKSRIDDEELSRTIEKLQDSISRFYFLLLLNDSNDHKQFPDLKVSFKGVVFYNGKQKCSDKENQIPNTFEAEQIQQIHQIFKDKQQQQKGELKCATILGTEEIPIQFYAEGFENGEIRVKFADIAMK